MEICNETVEAPNAWTPAELGASDEWIHHFTEDDLDELDRAVAHVRSLELETTEITREHFPLDVLADKIRQYVEELNDDRGIVLLRGLPVDTRYDRDAAAKVFWGIGQHMGTAVSQNARGDLLGDIVDKGSYDVLKRNYESNKSQFFHCDNSDVVGLMCLHPAHSGGVSLVASSVRMHNVMLDEHRDLLPLLYETYYFDRMGEHQPDEPPWQRCSMYSYHAGLVSGRFSANRIRLGQRFDDVPRLSPSALEAFDAVEAIPQRADEHHAMTLQQGDIQFLNNYVTVHSRTGWEDAPDPMKRRHLLRLWIRLDQSRPLAPDFAVRRSGVAPVPVA